MATAGRQRESAPAQPDAPYQKPAERGIRETAWLAPDRQDSALNPVLIANQQDTCPFPPGPTRFKDSCAIADGNPVMTGILYSPAGSSCKQAGR
jgi:hypothetical protein